MIYRQGEYIRYGDMIGQINKVINIDADETKSHQFPYEAVFVVNQKTYKSLVNSWQISPIDRRKYEQEVYHYLKYVIR